MDPAVRPMRGIVEVKEYNGLTKAVPCTYYTDLWAIHKSLKPTRGYTLSHAPTGLAFIRDRPRVLCIAIAMTIIAETDAEGWRQLDGPDMPKPLADKARAIRDRFDNVVSALTGSPA